MIGKVAVTALVWAMVAGAAVAGEIRGQATAIDGDTIEIHGQRIRLSGIDAPESRQVCEDARKQDVPCGRQSAFFLADLMGKHTVTCHEQGKDKYRRTLARCEVRGVDVGDAMVRAGHALAYRKYGSDYVPAEDAARQAKAGMWRYDFLPGWEWRALEKLKRG